MRRSLDLVVISTSILVTLAACGGDDDAPGTDGGMTAGDGSTNTDGGGGDCPAEVSVTEDITSDTTWSCPVYVLEKRVFITNDATLTIAPGTTIYGEVGGSETTALLATRGARLIARGTAEAPIVFTSGNPEGTRVTGDWAGVALMGQATINSGSCNGDGDPSTADVCDAPGFLEGRLEGIPPADDRGLFGGTDDASSCGELEYVRIEFAGAELSPDNELNGLTVAGCGSGTALSYIQVHRGKDDAIEFFGGTASIDHMVLSGASDDGLDWDLGWRGNGQFVVIHQIPGIGDNGIEADNLGSDEDALPRSAPNLSNFTMIGTPDTRGMVLREGTRGLLHNFIIQGFGSEPVDIRATQVDLTMEWPMYLAIENSVFYDNGAFADETVGEENDDMGFDEAAMIGDAARNNAMDTDPMLGTISPTEGGYVPAAAVGTPVAPTFGDTSANYVGAFEPGVATPWTAGWTAYPEN